MSKTKKKNAATTQPDEDLLIGDDLLNPCDEFVEPKEWTIILALNRIVDLAENSSLNKKFWESGEKPLAFLEERLGLSKMQVVIIAVMAEKGDLMTWKSLSEFFSCSRLTMMTYYDEIQDLLEKRWIYHSVKNDFVKKDGYTLYPDVLTAFRQNKVYVPEKIDGMDIQQFMNKMESHLDKALRRHGTDFEEVEEWMMQLCRANKQLPLCRLILSYDDINVQALLLMIAVDYAQWADAPEEGLSLNEIDDYFAEEYETNFMRRDLKDGNHVLIKDGLIEHKCTDGIADCNSYTLTRLSKEKLLEGYTPSCSKCVKHNDSGSDMKRHELVKTKQMFYNTPEQQEIERLTNMLSQDSLPAIQERLAEQGMRKGVACIFYGAPGTGKTETVYQIARQTGRDIMQIDIAGMRDKYVGESEKNIKAVFQRYRRVCRNAEVMPILFFNEADAIFGKRTTIGGNNPSVEKMDNAMQNILLQEMEDLDGILIATTNLTCNLDDAFDRRFLFKVEFNKPDDSVRAKLWSNILGDISDEDALSLAKRYEFSGGQIENIARKRTVDYILSGQKATIEQINEFCQHEMLSKGNDRKHIGF